MSLAITHFAIGAGAFLLLQPLLLPGTRYRGTLAVASGLWALVPDLHYVHPFVPRAFDGGHLATVGNVFWFHSVLDGLVQGRGSRLNAGIALGFLVGCVVVSDVWNARRSNREPTAADTPGRRRPEGGD